MGIPALDRLIPGGGLECGSLVEWLTPVDGCGAATLAMHGVLPALERGGLWVIVDPLREFYPPAVRSCGISVESLLLLHPTSIGDIAWTVEQCLRCPAVGTTWIQTEKLPDRVLQRWKKSAEIGGGIGVLFRPACTRRQPSWADLRWLVTPCPGDTAPRRRLCVELLTCRVTLTGASVELDVSDATGDVRLVSAMAGATEPVQATGA